jgi:hypothetical protein
MVEDRVDNYLRRYPESPIVEHGLGVRGHLARELP